MVKNNIIISSILLSFGTITSYAQPVGMQENAPTQEVKVTEDKGSLNFLDEVDTLAESVSNAQASANDYLIKKGWAEGLNEDASRYVAIGYAKISKKPSDKTFQLARQNAFSIALLEAKKSIAKFYAQEISARMEYVLLDPKSANARIAEIEAEAQINPSLMEKLTTLAHKKIDKELAKEGVEYDSEEEKLAAQKELVKDVLNETSFSEKIQSLATHQVGALVVSKIFEQDGEIIVVAYYSDKTKMLAGAINGKDVLPKAKARKGDSVGIWAKKLKKSQLYSAMGIQLTTDKDGNIVILSYGQARARSKSGVSKSSAYEKAELVADANIRRFAGETIIYNGELDNLENSKELDDGTGMSISEIEESFEKRISAIADKLTISGISTLNSWSLVDPRSDSLICGVVRMWSIKTADTANIDREVMKDAAINRGGRLQAPSRTGNSASKSSSANASSASSPMNVDTTKYKTESIESEDF